MVVMGIDYGTKRIGIALSDPQATMALPLETIPLKGDDSHLERIKKLAADYQVARVVVGLPYNMDGTLSALGTAVQAWARQLEQLLDLPVLLWDERLSTFEAHEMLGALQMKTKKRRQVVDQVAASLILKDYLDSLAS
jgi:putative holliday junction resolvase